MRRLPSPVQVSQACKYKKATYNGLQRVQVVAVAQLLPERVNMNPMSCVFADGAADRKKMKVFVQADRAGAHYGAKERYFSVNGVEKCLLIVVVDLYRHCAVGTRALGGVGLEQTRNNR